MLRGMSTWATRRLWQPCAISLPSSCRCVVLFTCLLLPSPLPICWRAFLQHHTFSTGGSNWYERWGNEDSLAEAINNVGEGFPTFARGSDACRRLAAWNYGWLMFSLMWRSLGLRPRRRTHRASPRSRAHSTTSSSWRATCSGTPGIQVGACGVHLGHSVSTL